MPEIEIIETKDGSSSLFLPEMNETYHSTHGAVTEALYVFLEKGLNHHREICTEKETVKILEIGFGTGLNAWLTALSVRGADFKIEYSSLEKYPVNDEIISKLNYIKAKPDEDKACFDQIHQAEWNQMKCISPEFSMEKIEGDIFEYDHPLSHFDVIYFDAFAPSKQPEIWSSKVLNKMFESLSENGVFSTYCAQGQFKRDLKSVGFDVESLVGPPGKKEMTRGTKRIA